MTSGIKDYTTNRKWISHTPEELKSKWADYLNHLSIGLEKKNKIDLYIYFLHTEEHYSYLQIANLLDSHYTSEKVTRQRIGQIVAKVRNSIRKGGDKS